MSDFDVITQGHGTLLATLRDQTCDSQVLNHASPAIVSFCSRNRAA